MAVADSKLVGIVNVTPDSFSDGGRYNDNAMAHCQQLIEQGAHILDIGAESTRPGATPLTPEEEWQRLENILPDIIKIAHKKNVMVSLDTRHAQTAHKAVACGVDWINDVGGLQDQAMVDVIKASNVKAVMMHNLGVPANPERILPVNEDPVQLVLVWLQTQLIRLEKQGIKRQRIIIDIGIGFGKNAQQSLALLKEIDTFTSLGCPLLVGHSRKSFLAAMTSKKAEDRDIETLATSFYLAQKGVDYLRVHHVDMHQRAIKIYDRLTH